MEKKRFSNDLRHRFEIHHALSHDIKHTPRRPLTNNEKTEEVDTRKRQQEGKRGGSRQAQQLKDKHEVLEGKPRAREPDAEAKSEMRIGRTEVELQFQSQRTRLADERRAKQLEIAEGEARDTVKQIVMGGSTLVTYGAGLNVQHIVCGFESCFLTIKNLPQNVQASEVEELFTQLGVDCNLFHIVKMRQVNDEVQAKVLSDSEVGQAIAAGLTGIEFRDGHYLDITVGNGPSPRRDINVLTVAWTLPSSTMVAEYSTEDGALNALNRLNNAMFRRRKLRAEWYRASGGLFVAHSTSNPSIKISDLPLNVTTAEVGEYSGADLVWILTVLPGHDLTHIVERIEGFEGYEVNLPNPDRFNAEVRFQFSTWDDAKRAQNYLEGWRLSHDYPPLHAWLPMPIQYISTIPLPQYHAQQGLWDSMPVEKDNDKSAFVRVINKTDTTFIFVLGEDKKAVGQLKVRVENVLAGETLDRKLWDRSFADASGQRFFNNIRTRTNAYVRVDSKSKILKLYADRDVRQTVIDLVKARTAHLELSEWSIPIPTSTTEFFVRKGLHILTEELGKDAAMLELRPTPRLIIRGGEEARQKVDRLIEESLSGIEHEAYDGENDTCPVCFSKASSPVLLSCGHLYCVDCLRHFLSSAVEGKTFPLVCLGSQARCGVPISIPVIRRFLLQQQFDQLTEAAAKAYIEKQPTKFKYCATPDCLQSYRCREDSWTLTCPSCFASVCSSCHKEPHDGMTCREKFLDSVEEQERLNEAWARGAGAKRCPSCRIWIQKTEGCNHLSCRCGTHICWNCLATFSKAEDVYGHLRTVHRGIHVNNVLPEPYLELRHRNDIGAPHQGQRQMGHGNNLIFAWTGGHVQGQPGRQPQPDIHRSWLQRLRLSMPRFFR